MVTNIGGVSKGVNFDGKTLADIFAERSPTGATAARTPNPGVRFPNAPITLCVRSDVSGTSFNSEHPRTAAYVSGRFG